MENRVWFIIIVFNFNGMLVCGNNLFVKRFENCDPNVNYTAMYNFTLKTVGNKQYLDGTKILSSPWDNTLRANTSIEILTGKHYFYLFSINERKSCDALHKYFGEFVYDMERRAGGAPGICPIPKIRADQPGNLFYKVKCDYDFEEVDLRRNSRRFRFPENIPLVRDTDQYKKI